MIKFLSEHEVRVETCAASTRKGVQKQRQGMARIRKIQDLLKYPSDRPAAIELFYGKKHNELKGADRQLAEGVVSGLVIEGVDQIRYFSQNRVDAIVETLGCGPVSREYNAALAKAFVKHADAIAEYLRPAYAAAGLENEVEFSPPVSRFRELSRRADEGSRADDFMASTGFQSLFSFIPEDET